MSASDFTADKCPGCPPIRAATPREAHTPVEPLSQLSSRELICSTETESKVPPRHLPVSESEAMAGKAPGRISNAPEGDQRTCPSIRSQGAFSATWSAWKGM
jgi:hypothetical protein